MSLEKLIVFVGDQKKLGNQFVGIKYWIWNIGFYDMEWNNCTDWIGSWIYWFYQKIGYKFDKRKPVSESQLLVPNNNLYE